MPITNRCGCAKAATVGWELYEDTPMPRDRAEEWRRTDYRSIHWDEASPLISGRMAPRWTPFRAQMLEPLIGDGAGRDAGVCRWQGGAAASLSAALAEQGVIFTDLLTACRDHEVAGAPAPDDQSGQAGRWQVRGAARGAVDARRFPVCAAAARSSNCRCTSSCTTRSRARRWGMCWSCWTKRRRRRCWSITSRRIRTSSRRTSARPNCWSAQCGESALCRLAGLESQDLRIQPPARAASGAMATLDWVLGTMGAQVRQGLHRSRPRRHWARSTRVSGMFFADENQFFDLDTQQNHNGPLTVSDLLFKGAAKHRSAHAVAGDDQVAAEHAEDRRLSGVPQPCAERRCADGRDPRSGDRGGRRALHARGDLRHARRSSRSST